MKKKEKTVCQIIRFRGKIEAFFVSIDEFDTSTNYTHTPLRPCHMEMVYKEMFLGKHFSNMVYGPWKLSESSEVTFI